MDGQKIRRDLKNLRLRQYELAAQIGVSESTLIRWMRGEISDEQQQRIEEALDALKREVGHDA